MKILIAVDGSAFSDAAVAAVAERPWPEGSAMKVVSAFETAFPPTPEAWAIPPEYFDELQRSAREGAQLATEAAVAKLKLGSGHLLELTAAAIQGPPKNVILDEAEHWGADLIVLGSHGYRGWERFLLGSVSHAVVSHAKCSVEVVRRPENPD
jgi:nucleotide-binding universal stress UspA family protein